MDILKRNARIKAVHAACRKAGVDGDTRHAIQQQVTGKGSLSDMSVHELNNVLDHLNRLTRQGGTKKVNEWAFVFKLNSYRQPYAKKIFRMAERIGALQQPAVPVMSKAYIEGIAEQMMGAPTVLEFCDPEQLHKIVQVLEVYVQRHGRG